MFKPVSSIFLSCLLLAPTVALAEQPAPVADTTPQNVEEDETYDFGANNGEGENPDAPTDSFNSEQLPKEAVVKKRHRYPNRVVDRPINIPRGMSEVALQSNTFVSPFVARGDLRLRYGVTDIVQVGLRYGTGQYADSGFAVGKTVALHAQVQITDFVAVQLALPMYLDPFAMGMSLGAPVQWVLFENFMLQAGEDLLRVKLNKFLPTDNPLTNTFWAEQEALGAITPVWVGNLSVRAVYQVDDKLAVNGKLGEEFDDTIAAARTLLEVGAVYVPTKNFDVGAQLGTESMADFLDNSYVSIFGKFYL